MEALKAFDFGHIIAFMLPGFVASRAVAYYLPHLADAFDKATAGGDGAVVPLLFLIIISLTVGLAISIIRQQWLDPRFGWLYGCFKEGGKIRPPWKVDYGVIMGVKDIADQFDKAIAQVYRYYQFIGNLGIAVLLLAALRYFQTFWPAAGTSPPPRAGTYLLGLGALFFLITAYYQFEGWCRVHNSLSSAAREKARSASQGTAQGDSPGKAPGT